MYVMVYVRIGRMGCLGAVDPCEKVAALGNVVVSVMKSGEIAVWTGLKAALYEDIPQSDRPPFSSEIRIPPPVLPPIGNGKAEEEIMTSPISCQDKFSSQISSLTIAYMNHPHFCAAACASIGIRPCLSPPYSWRVFMAPSLSVSNLHFGNGQQEF